MNDKIPKYCYNCGNKLEREKFVAYYNEQTGKPYYRVRVHCQTCRNNGEMVYFQRDWEPESKLNKKRE